MGFVDSLKDRPPAVFFCASSHGIPHRIAARKAEPKFSRSRPIRREAEGMTDSSIRFVCGLPRSSPGSSRKRRPDSLFLWGNPCKAGCPAEKDPTDRESWRLRRRGGNQVTGNFPFPWRRAAGAGNDSPKELSVISRNRGRRFRVSVAGIVFHLAAGGEFSRFRFQETPDGGPGHIEIVDEG